MAARGITPLAVRRMIAYCADLQLDLNKLCDMAYGPVEIAHDFHIGQPPNG